MWLPRGKEKQAARRTGYRFQFHQSRGTEIDQGGIRAGQLRNGAARARHRGGRRDHGRATGCQRHHKDIRHRTIKTKNVATSVSGHSVIVKRVPLPLMTEEELYDRIPSEASQHIPFDIADVNLSYQLLEAMDSQMDVLLVAVKKDKILNHTNVLAQAERRRWWWTSTRLVCRTASK